MRITVSIPITKDSTLQSSNPTTNYGASSTLQVGPYFSNKHRLVIHVDLTSLPNDAIIVDAYFPMYCFTSASSGGGVSAHKIKRITQPSWVEAEVTHERASTALDWTDGGDFTETDALPWTPPSAVGPFTVGGLATLTQDAITNRSKQLHLIFMADDEGLLSSKTDIYSKEWGTLGQRPYFVVVYDTDFQFPTNVSFGSSGGPEFSTSVLEVSSGREERISKWNTPKRHYDVSYGIRSYADLVSVLKFYIAVQGSLNSFRYKDWTDFTSASNHHSAYTYNDQVIGIGDGTTVNFQLCKRYISGIFSRIRPITKPVVGTVVTATDGLPTLGWKVNTSTGIATATVAPAQGVVVTAGFEFDVPVRFEDSIDDLLSITSQDFGSGLISINLVEVLNDVSLPEDVYHGGGDYRGSLGTDDTFFSICPLNGFALEYISGNSKDVRLPDISKIPSGGPIMAFRHDGVYDLYDHLGNLVHNDVPDYNFFHLLVGIKADGSKCWMSSGEEIIVP